MNMLDFYVPVLAIKNDMYEYTFSYQNAFSIDKRCTDTVLFILVAH